MTLSPSHLRLLPWSDDGKPAFLSTDGTATPLSLLADMIEEQQIETASVVLDLSRAVLGSGTPATADEYRFRHPAPGRVPDRRPEHLREPGAAHPAVRGQQRV